MKMLRDIPDMCFIRSEGLPSPRWRARHAGAVLIRANAVLVCEIFSGGTGDIGARLSTLLDFYGEFSNSRTAWGTVPIRDNPYRPFFDAINQIGVPGQGNPDPPGAFENHYIVSYGGLWYDPSYGTGPFLTTIAHEEASIDGIGANSAVKKRSNGPELIYSPR